MNKKGTAFILAGCFAIVAAASLVGYNIFDSDRAKKTAAEAYGQMIQYISEVEKEVDSYTKYEDVEFVPDYILYPEMEMPLKDIDGNKYVGVIEIPVLNITLPVLSEMSNKLLKIAPCRYEGTAYLTGFVIGAHNYTSHFSNLKLLEAGDEVIFRDNAGNTFYYSVILTETLQPAAVEEMKSDEWDLTLFTCTPGGQYRVAVRCESAD